MARKKAKLFSLFPETFVVTGNLSDTQFGCLMRSAFVYSQEGKPYTGNDAAVDMAFRFIANQLDRMAEVAETNSQNARSKSGKRNVAESCEIPPNEADSRGNNELSKTLEAGSESDVNQGNSPPIPSYPVHSVPIHSNPNPISNIVVADDINTTAASSRLQLMGGQLGKGKVVLSEAQIEDLLDKLGDVEVFDYYVEKLANWIIKRDADVKDHYGTILKWWRQDSNLER